MDGRHEVFSDPSGSATCPSSSAEAAFTTATETCGSTETNFDCDASKRIGPAKDYSQAWYCGSTGKASEWLSCGLAFWGEAFLEGQEPYTSASEITLGSSATD